MENESIGDGAMEHRHGIQESAVIGIDRYSNNN
jgi:hypothetical protein